MKTALKLIRNRVLHNIETKKEIAPSSVSFILVAKNVLGCRESAKVMNIAKETNTFIQIISGKKSGNSKSIISLMNLGILPEKSFVLSIKGENNQEAFKEVRKVLLGETENSSK